MRFLGGLGYLAAWGIFLLIAKVLHLCRGE